MRGFGTGGRSSPMGEVTLAWQGDLGAGCLRPWARIDRELVFRELSGIDSVVTGFDPNSGFLSFKTRKRSSKKKTSPQSSSGNPCTNEEIVPKEEFEVEQEEKEAYWDALCGPLPPILRPSGVLQSPERGCVPSPGA
ncbi:hypothetical protein F2Q70_00011884 [Brassica cretica]|uniref:Uncharacterized protein n=1 Tax=Brassica cretica TaxID=69181 RepID=A0A8S9JMK5_BRACR|nr:hypothetical protein F2Q68_00005446 [Brassica cretica]KAF2616170.1 hypothetical protein F2Q70_00011884 [Brassica cretica]